jgi:hypothetical protein
MTSNSEERRRRLVAVPPAGALPDMITVRGARQNNLQNIDIDIPLWRTVAVVGVSGSGETSLAMGTLYAEGLQRLLAGLSTYSRRRLDQVQRPDVDRIEHLPATLARCSWLGRTCMRRHFDRRGQCLGRSSPWLVSSR